MVLQNAYLTKMLQEAGLKADAHVVKQKIQAVLTEELHHRMKNMLTMVTAIVRQSMRSALSLAEAESAISTRLIAMARAHDLLLKTDLKSATLHEVIDHAVAQHSSANGSIDVAGETLLVNPSAILPLTLIVNELCTNATKYGALSVSGGSISLRWNLVAADATLVLDWVEKDGPQVRGPGSRSFGARLLEDAIPRQLGGVSQLAFPVSGVTFRLTVPLDKLRPTQTV